MVLGSDITGGDPHWDGVTFDICPVALANEPWIGDVWQRSLLAVGPEGGGIPPLDIDALTPAYADALYVLLCERAALRSQQIKDAAPPGGGD